VLIWFGAARTQEPAPPADRQVQPSLTIDVNKTHVAIRGIVSSVAHESILRQRVITLYPQRTKSFELREQPALPPGWALISEIALRATAEIYSSTIEISPSRIHIRGIVSSAANWQEGLLRIERNLPPGMRLDHELSEINAATSLDRQCISLFRTAMRGRKIEFPRASAALGTSAAPLLDELMLIAADCPAAIITITGHTDNTGNESGNLALSKARADAVAAYMSAGGISAERFATNGAGSSRPLVAEGTAQAHQLNRRIDIEIAFPEA
jgi:OOP family OmpA-OmpF porin